MEKTAKERMVAGELYRASDPELNGDRARARELCQRFNALVGRAPEEAPAVLQELLGRCPDRVWIEAGLRCDYGYNLFLGDNFYANFDFLVLDVCPVRIGRNCLVGPRVSIFAASHPLDAGLRREGWEEGRPVTIGDDVWIGGGVIINPGVTVGDRAVVGSGAVVTRDVPSDVVVAGNPARVIRRL